MEKDYKMTIGLEIHAELITNSKMFCGCKNGEDDKPNSNICPVCLGLPGTLPVINKDAVKKVIMVGKAIGGKIADFSEFDRKNYFYPDIPKGYQISQYKYPLVSGGSLNGVEITRIHLEEDTAKSTHIEDYSLVDFNRAGVPLMELVTEPVMHSKEEVGAFAKELQLLLQYLDISFANMEKGQMRVEVNISISNSDKFGTKVEVKNINSFKSAMKAVEYEFERQTKILDRGESVLQETRGFDENKQITFSQRSKENSNDYRYFPDPDLPKIYINQIEDFKNILLKETPNEKRIRFALFGIKKEDIEVYINNNVVSLLFEETIRYFNDDKEKVQLLSNYITSDILGFIKNDIENNKIKNIESKFLAKVILMLEKGDISSRGAKEILKIMFDFGGDPEEIAKEKDLIQKNDPKILEDILSKIINNNKSVVEEYKNGKESAIQFFVGQAMKETKGSGNPGLIKEIALKIINNM